MRPQFLNLVQSSFSLWLDNFILSKGSGVSSVSSKFYPVGQTFNGLYTYAAPYQPFVYDASVVSPMTGILINGTPIQRGVSGFVDINYRKGQVYFNSNVNSSAISGNYTVNEINILPLDISEQKLLFETKFTQRSKTSQTVTGLQSNTYTYPSIYIKGFSNTNTPYSFGGEDLSEVTIGLFLIMDSAYQSDAVRSILADSKLELVPLLTQDKFPMNIYGGLKETGSNFNFETLKTGYISAGSGMYIKDVVINSFKREYNVDSNNLNPDVYWAVADVVLCKSRYPRNLTNNL